jgi:hypothetical protein
VGTAAILWATVASAAPRGAAPVPAVLPDSIAEYLATAHLRVLATSGACNVLQGQFIKQKQVDWAVGVSDSSGIKLLVFPGGMVDSVQDAPRTSEWSVGNSMPECAFTVLRRSAVQNFIDAWGQLDESGKTITRANHDGIVEHSLGGYSIILYCQEGKWVAITGMD